MADLYNKEALEALDSHGEEDELPRVARPRLLLVLAAMGTILLVVIYWCLFGTVSYKVAANGVVFPFGEATPLVVPFDGTVARSFVTHGAPVAAGTPVLEVRNGLSSSAVTSPRDGVVLSTLAAGTAFKAGEPVVWLMPQKQQMAGREMLCYLEYDDLRKIRLGQQVQVTPSDLAREEWGYAYGKVVGIEQYPTSRKEVAARLKLDPLAAFVPDGKAVYELRVVLDEKDGHLVWSRNKSGDVKVGNGTLCNIQVITRRLPVWRVLVGSVDDTVESMLGN